MRILAVGDFHGKFPKKFLKIIKSKKVDVLVSNGDYLPFHYRKLWFKYCFDKNKGLWEFIGKKRYKQLINKDLKEGERVLKILNKIGIPVVTVLGNIDYPDPDDIADPKFIKKRVSEENWEFENRRVKMFADYIKKYSNIVRIDYSSVKIGKVAFIGMRGHSFPGVVKSKAFRKHKNILVRLFNRFKVENRNNKVVFLSHNVPYNTRLDKLSMKAHKIVRGKHYGSKLTRKIVDKFQPSICIGGHVHESAGIQKVGRTLCINPGAVHQGKGVLIDIPEQNERGKKIKARLIK